MEEKSIVENGKRKLFKNKLSDTLPILYLITMVLVILGQSLGSFLGLIPFTTSTGAAMTATMYFLFIGIWIWDFISELVVWLPLKMPRS